MPKLEKMIKPDPVYVPKMLSKRLSKISESNIEPQIFDNSIETPKGEGDSKILGPMLVIIVFGAIVGLSVYLINRYEKEEKIKIKFD